MKNSVTGYITAVQEQRFRLMTDRGSNLLLTLGNFLRLSHQDLRSFHSTHAHVRVEYTGEPDLDSGVAHSIQLLDDGAMPDFS